MNLKFQLSIAFIISLVSLIGFGFMAFLVSSHEIIQFDQTVISFIQGLESSMLTAIMKFFTLIGSTYSIVVLSLLVLFFLYSVFKHRSELILFIAVVLGSNILFKSLKWFFHRARPDFHRLIEVGGYSFPSGHATNAITLYGILAFLLWRHIPVRWGRMVLIVISTMMMMMIGTSRIYLGVHYPTDIISGYLVGGFWLAIAIWFYQRYQKKRQKRKNSSDM
ncbi:MULTISPECIES: phosphatase PAP2 family protein [Bacillaceae]|uniref:Phosphoesterase PA-phosphatase n=1 Tax=Domibacillus aminovorans TaxID=29332 RepID=A0A177L449_9BACI|nr:MULTISPECIES: phosphatase PAP2 family protein [Bacillaceae]OAH59541.1 phosphoesterase PA-phosphatase [Domibacillus aminovorans]